MSTILRLQDKLDALFARNDYAGAERLLLSRGNDAAQIGDLQTFLFIQNELAGLYRKTNRETLAFHAVKNALDIVKAMRIQDNIGAATTYLNCATVYQAFGRAKDAMPLFERAQHIYEEQLPENDPRFGGLYNNMALALVDLCRFQEAYTLYDKAIALNTDDRILDTAITYLNIASAKEAELGLEAGEEFIAELLNKAMKILDDYSLRNGYYAFVCEKCASVFGYYGYFVYKNELLKRARAIYEGS